MTADLGRVHCADGEAGRRVPSCSINDPTLAEPRFGILGCEVEADVRYCATRTDTWTSSVPGVEQVGALAVLLDHILGEVGNQPQPSGMWAPTTELAFDVLVPPPWHSQTLRASAVRILDGRRAGHHQALVTDERGRLIATASAWTAYVPTGGAAPLPAGGPAITPPVPSGNVPLLDLLGVQLVEDGSMVRADGLERPAWANQYGALHGGVLACVAEMAAARLLGERALSTSHVHVAYLRPARTAGVSIVARAVHRGRTFGLAEALGVDDDGRLCCRATITARA